MAENRKLTLAENELKRAERQLEGKEKNLFHVSAPQPYLERQVDKFQKRVDKYKSEET